MAEMNGEVFQSESLRDAIFTWIPEAVRVHNVRFMARYWLDDEVETEFLIIYDPDETLLDLQVFERFDNGFMYRGVELDAATGEVHEYDAHLVDAVKSEIPHDSGVGKLLKAVGATGIGMTVLTRENEEFFIKILNGNM